MAQVTPMMQCYLDTKEKYKDCILFYRIGDFMTDTMDRKKKIIVSITLHLFLKFHK